MKVMILGCDGYIGYPLTYHLLRRGYKVFGIDNTSRRDRVLDLGSDSLTPILPASVRKYRLRAAFEKQFDMLDNVTIGESYHTVAELMKYFKPDAIVHLAEQPSAPWSMQDVWCASETQYENVIGTLHILWAMHESCPDAHLIKLGTMGEYGTPECDIPEGKIPIMCLGYQGHERNIPGCPMSGLPFPRQPGSFYHLSKVHDTHNIIFACNNWGLRSTDIMQGIVFGLASTHEEELTRFDYDQYFGTAINRFCVQALAGIPLTIYGKGEQTRGFLTLKDSIQCLTIALENPPEQGEYRTLNQFESIYTINELATMVARGANELELKTGIEHIPNPRYEAEEHYYNPAHQKLFDLGYVPDTNIQGNINSLLEQLLPYKDRIQPGMIMPTTKWR